MILQTACLKWSPPQCDPLEYVLLVHCFALCQCTHSNDPITRPRAFCDPDQGAARVHKQSSKARDPDKARKTSNSWVTNKSQSIFQSGQSQSLQTTNQQGWLHGGIIEWDVHTGCHKVKNWCFYIVNIAFFCVLGGERGVGDAGPKNWSEISDPEACNHHHPACYNRLDPQK